jgi:membrane associated rhomboid family serine protease
MNRSPIAQATSRIGPGLKFVLGAIAVVGLLQAVLIHWVGMPQVWNFLVCTTEGVLSGQLWRLLTAGFLTDITHPLGLLFTLVGLYFLAPDLEKRWGTGRFLWFLALSVILGNVLAIGVDWLAPLSLALLHPRFLYGAGAPLVATAIAWGMFNQTQQVYFSMIIPVSGKTLVWITVGGCFLYLLYQGDVETFGGVVTGLTMVGEPSFSRRMYLRLKLALLRRRTGGIPTAHQIAHSSQPILRKRPPLRVVQGGQGGPSNEPDEPRDKRYLN